MDRRIPVPLTKKAHYRADKHPDARRLCAPARRPRGAYGAAGPSVVTIADMEFFCYHRDRPGSEALREELLEEHWSHLDRYAARMIARGPTFTTEDESATGSVHIVDLPNSAAARAFAFDEPYYQAGVYRDVLLRRWRNGLSGQCGSFQVDHLTAGGTW